MNGFPRFFKKIAEAYQYGDNDGNDWWTVEAAQNFINQAAVERDEKWNPSQWSVRDLIDVFGTTLTRSPNSFTANKPLPSSASALVMSRVGYTSMGEWTSGRSVSALIDAKQIMGCN